MKKSVITLAAALALAAPMAALAQSQDPNQAPVIIPDQQPEQPVKKKKKHQSEQPAARQVRQRPEQAQPPTTGRRTYLAWASEARDRVFAPYLCHERGEEVGVVGKTL